MIKHAIAKVVEGENLSREEARQAFDEIMQGRAAAEQIAALIVALKMKGESIQEIVGAAESMKAVMAMVKPKLQGDLLDVVGTGGDKKNTINVSTAAALVAAGAGCLVAKHGNRSVSSKCGAADVLEKLGVKIDRDNETNARLLEEIGIAFLFAPCHHPAMKYAAPVRQSLGIRTIFNILGPITNPASPATFLLGVFALDLAEKLAGVLAELGLKKALVVHGNDGFDELSLSDSSTVFEVNRGKIQQYQITPWQFGLQKCHPEQVASHSIEENAEILLAILRGEETGPKRDIVLLNAGAAIYANGKAESIEAGIEKARKSIQNHQALKKLEKLIAGSTDTDTK